MLYTSEDRCPHCFCRDLVRSEYRVRRALRLWGGDEDEREEYNDRFQCRNCGYRFLGTRTYYAPVDTPS